MASEYLGYEHEEEVRGYFCSKCGYYEILAQEWGQQDYKEDERFFESRLKNFDELPEFFNSISEIIKKIKTHDNFCDMTPRQFEQLTYFYVREVLHCDVTMTKSTRDGGFDLVGLDTDSGPIVIEAKKYNKKRIDVSIIRQMAGVQLINDVPNSVIVTTGKVTKDAIRERNRLNTFTKYQLDIHDINDLMVWLGQVKKDVVKIDIRSILNKIGFLHNSPINYMIYDINENKLKFSES